MALGGRTSRSSGRQARVDVFSPPLNSQLILQSPLFPIFLALSGLAARTTLHPVPAVTLIVASENV